MSPPGSTCAPSSRTMARSARLPGSIEPTLSPRPRACAPSIVASRSARRAGSAVTPDRTFARRRGVPQLRPRVEVVVARSAVRAERELHAQPVELRHAGDPEPSFRFALGQCTTRVPSRAIVAPPSCRAGLRAPARREARRHPTRAGRPRRPVHATRTAPARPDAPPHAYGRSRRSRRPLDRPPHEPLVHDSTKRGAHA